MSEAQPHSSNKMSFTFTFLLILFLTNPFCAYAESNDARKLIREVVNNYAGIDTYSDSTTIEFYLYTPNRNMMVMEYEIKLDKPDKFLVTNPSEPFGREVISNGKYLWKNIPSLKKYTKNPAPENFMDILAPDFSSASQLGSAQFILFTFFEKDNKYLSDKSVKIISQNREISDSSVTNQILIEGENINMVVWIDEKRLLINKITFDMKEFIKKRHSGEDIDTDKITMTYTEIHDNIVTDPPLNEDIFNYKGGKDLQLVESLSDTGIREAGSGNPGNEFIDFKFRPANSKKEIQLSDFKGSKIMLGFIDSGTTQASDIAKIFNRIQNIRDETNLKIIWIDTSGDEKQLNDFIIKNNITYTAASDETGDIESKYALDPDNPVVYIISPDGIIRQIYTGYFTGLKEYLIEDIEYMDFEYPISQSTGNRPVPGIKEMWNHKIKVLDFTVYQNDAVALTSPKGIQIISDNGKIKNAFKISGVPPDTIVTTGRKEDNFFLAYRKNMDKLYSYSPSGKLLWEISTGYSISDIKIIQSTDSAKIIAALNAPTGPVCYDTRGKQLWQTDTPGYISRLTVGEFFDGGRLAAITNKGDMVYILNSQGEIVREINIKDIYLDFISALSVQNRYSKLFIAGSSHGNEILKLLNGNLKESIWETILGNAVSSNITGIARHPLKEIYAVTTKNGNLYLFNDNGEIAGEKQGLGFGVKADWIELEPGSFMLLSGSVDKGLSAYSIDVEETR
ncbi:MAG: redoxin domain-containing protein [Elusimicrobia bacterium]|nr:redoxin domain-containing protein [Elusimicrobiota bacterium]